MIMQLSTNYPVGRLCALLDCPRSSYYYQPVPTDETALRTAIEQIVIRWPYYGYRRMTAQLRREGWTVNSKVVRRLLHEFGLHGRVGRVRWHTTDSAHALPRYANLVRDVAANYPDQIWCAEIVCTQMTKTHLLTIGTCGNNVADLNLLIRHNHAIHQ